ncbi:MAG TPA: hypothetical protein DD745_07750 [Bacteroidales bacterium]|nr:hypothetical protein [Bacteroidales bacterium]
MKKLLCFLIILFVFFYLPAFSQEDQADSTGAAVDTLTLDFGLFNSDEILNLSLRFDLTEYMRKKPKEEYLPAILTYHISDKDSINKEIKLRSRGIARNNICNFPPISLNFKKSDIKAPGMKKVDKIKMVTHCNSGNEEYLFKEFLIYKLYNVLTEYSFRVRLVKVDYISTAKKTRTIRSYAFLIEPLDMLADRTNSTSIETLTLTQRNIIPEIMDRMNIFNYMIGNTDWSVTGQHNCKILSVIDPGHPGLGGIVPYDFDYAGLVNAHYALPAEGLGLESVRVRRYLGDCRSEEEFNTRLKEFSEKKSEFYRIINEFTSLDEKDKKYMTGYLDGFFNSLEKGYLITSLKRECRNQQVQNKQFLHQGYVISIRYDTKLRQ